MSTRMKKARGDGKGSERISRDMLQTKTLSLKARGLLSLLKSLTDDWDCGGVAGISKTFCDKDGPHAVNEAIKELEAHGLFARLKHQGEGGKWDWLWTFADYPDEVAAEVRRWEARGFRTATRSGNRSAVAPRRDDAGPMSEDLEHGAMTEKPADGNPADGEPPNKDSSPPLEEESSTGQKEHTHASRAASPPCVDDAPAQIESLDKPAKHSEGKESGPSEENFTGTAQMTFCAQDEDPFSDQDARDLDDIPLTGRQLRSSTKVVNGWNKTKHSPASEVLVDAYCKTAPMLRESRNDLLPFVDKLLAQGVDDGVILRAIPAMYKARCGPTLLHRFVTQILHEDAVLSPREATSTRNMNEQRENHDLWFRSDGSMRTPEEIAALGSRHGDGLPVPPIIVAGEVVRRELPR